MTECGIVRLVNPEQPPKAWSPIEETEFGIETPVRDLQPWNAQFFIKITESGMINLPESPEQPWKAPSPIVVTDFGRRIPINPLHS